jgi:hypothetical protein
MHCADLEASFVGTAAMSSEQHGQMAKAHELAISS